MEELIGKMNATVQAYNSAETTITPNCTRIHKKIRGTQQKKSVNTTADIFIAIFNSFCKPWLRDAAFADALAITKILIQQYATEIKHIRLTTMKIIMEIYVAIW